MYREFSVRCTREHLVRLSDWLNENLDFEGGEDFDKLAEEPRAAQKTAEGDGEENEICKTDRKGICSHLDWVCRYLQSQKDLSTTGQNKIRLMKKLIVKLGGEVKDGQ